MPIGCTSLIPFIAQDLYLRRPRRVLDLGCGNGIYGALVRNYCGNLAPESPTQTYLVGVEGFGAYRNPLWDVYDRVKVQPIPDFLVASDHHLWDVIILVDVIEHFEHAAGWLLLKQLKTRLNPGGVLWVGTPAIWLPQGATFGNDFETHRSLWDAEEFELAGLRVLLDGTQDVHGNQMLLGRFDAPHQGAAEP